MKGCKVTSENPSLHNKDLKVMPGNGGMVDIGDYAEVRCKDQSEVTDTFDILKLVSLNLIFFARAKGFVLRQSSFFYPRP